MAPPMEGPLAPHKVMFNEGCGMAQWRVGGFVGGGGKLMQNF